MMGHKETKLAKLFVEHSKRVANTRAQKPGRWVPFELGIRLAHVEEDVGVCGGACAAVLMSSRANSDSNALACGIFDCCNNIGIGVAIT